MPPSFDAEAWGVEPGYVDVDGVWREAPPASVDAVLRAMGATADGPPPAPAPAPGRRPARCPPPPATRAWGWATQLYAVRSRASWGIGDLGDLARLCTWARKGGAGFVLVNPMHASAPVAPQQPSPYFPSSRRFRDVTYLRVEDVPGVDAVDIEAAARAGRALNDERLIDRDEVVSLKLGVLEQVWGRTGPGDAFERFVEEQGAALEEWATFCVLAESHGADWRAWPNELLRPDSAAVDRAGREQRDRVRFHQWLQWLLDDQLAAASSGVDVMHDLAVGFDPGGADAWVWKDLLAPGISIGAPPDPFNTLGQIWGLPPFDPWKLRAAGYRPFVETIRAAVRHAGALRIDHALGLARLYWVPDGAAPTEGVYVRYPFDDLLDVIGRETTRAGAYVVAEDLGTSTPEILAALAQHGLLSYRLLYFEETPADIPELAMAAVTTHDLPTLAGLWSGQDVREQQRLGLQPNVDGWEEIRSQLAKLAHARPDAPVEDFVAGVHEALAETPAVLVGATLDDALGVIERPNMPGTTTQWPNWCVALPLTLEELEHHPLAERVAEVLRAARPG